jgi:hypothetical protein
MPASLAFAMLKMLEKSRDSRTAGRCGTYIDYLVFIDFIWF